MPESDEKEGTVRTGLLVTRVKLSSPLYSAAVHLTLSLAAGVPLLLSWTIPLEALPLRRCPFLWITGIPCPFCGVTRAFWLAGQGDITSAWQECPLGLAVYSAAALLLAWNLVGLLSVRLMLPGRLLVSLRHLRKPAIITGILLVLINWAYRVLMGLR